MDKAYNPKLIEDSQYQYWLEKGYFHSEVDPSRERFSMVLPPPNVTGSLHVGHALDHTLPDIIVRWQRMLGKNTLWVPGTDHAGISTQMVVERQLVKEGTSRQQLGREVFLKRTWEWKKYSHDLIVRSMQKLGISCDWVRERFTMDEGLSRAVRTAFVQLYKDGLIYRDEYIVNWCTSCKTAISDLEVKHEQKDGSIYYVRYPIEGTSEFVTVATTRPETMLGDTAVAVHPEDPRYTNLIGKTAILPLLNRKIPVIADSFVDREFGTGAVKITPAHDPNDFLAAKRNQIPLLLVIDGDGKMLPPAGPYAGLDRFQARKKVLADLRTAGLLVKEEKHQYSLGYCDRCKTVVEPLLSLQWFLRMKSLAEPAIQAVEEGRIQFHPENWAKTYFEWMRNIHDWCISRQLWWGHRIPAWHCENCGFMNVDVDPPERCSKCGQSSLRQETDVLDTWFSSGLWPFSVFGWPDQTPELHYYYPTDLLVTGFDIIFFWVARMIMFGLKFMHEVPFRDVYIHGLVRDEHGQKMSKSKGNTLDPLDLIEQFGADSLRFTLAIVTVPGPDIPLSEKRIQGYKAFLNKLWNSVRFALMNLKENEKLVPLEKGKWDLADRWITSRFNHVAGEINRQLHEYRFDLASNAAYQFLWHEFCDWYLEWIKPYLNDDAPDHSAKKGLLFERIADVLRLLHPFVPFITEYLWQQLPSESRISKDLIIARYPEENSELLDEEAERQFEILMELIGKIRQIRSEMNIEPSKKIEVFVRSVDNAELIERYKPQVQMLSRAASLKLVPALPDDLPLARGVIGAGEIGVNLTGVLDLNAERERLRKELKRIQADLYQAERKLSNYNFIRNAPEDVIRQQRLKFEDLNGRKQRTEQHLQALE
jgi:valyl-tRNA synthetase